MESQSWLTYEMFAAVVGKVFAVHTGDDPLELILLEATDSGRDGGVGAGGESRTQFAVLFEGPPAPQLRQGTYLVASAEIGEFALFLVPIGLDAQRTRYESVFG